MLLQLTYMVLPLQRWDWARYLGAGAVPLFVIAKASNDNVVTTPQDALELCGVFTFLFAFIFQQRILPRLGEGTIVMWTVVLLCVLVELEGWHSLTTYLAVGAGLVVLVLLVARATLPYVLKLGLYAWYLLMVVVMGVLQFRKSDFSLLMADGASRLDYRFAFIDGLAGAYIGVHATFLYELLPIPGKSEQWKDFKIRWRGYLDLIVSRLDDQRLNTMAALVLVVGIVLVVVANHHLEMLPDRSLTYLVLLVVPIGWRAAARWWVGLHPGAQAAGGLPTVLAATAESTLSTGVGRRGHSRKHRRQ
jgi:hypothetical protein